MKELKTSWLDRARAGAREIFKRTDPPAKTVETWRRVNFGAWRLELLSDENLSVMLGPEKNEFGTAKEAHPLPAAPELNDAAGAFRQDGNRLPAGVALAPELSKKGVVFLSLEEAAAKHPELVEPHLKELIGAPDFRMMESASLAFFRGGVFLYIPAGIKIDSPIDISFSQQPAGSFCFPRVLVIAEKGSQATVVEGYHFDPGAADAAQAGDPASDAEPGARKLSSVAFSRLIVGAGARLRYFYAQELSSDTAHFWHQQVDLAENALLQHYSLLLGAAVHKSELDVRLTGPGGRSEIYGAVLGGQNQLFDPHTAQRHQAARTQSDLLFRSAIFDRARSIYTGLIRIDPHAVQSEAFQRNNNLILSNEARADTTPVLEILTNDVRCKHGATVGPVNPEELFYLCSRGLDPKEAEKILILGFLDPWVGQLPLDRLRERIADTIEKKLKGYD